MDEPQQSPLSLSSLPITYLRAAGIDDADLAEVAGHTVETMTGPHTDPLGRSHDRIRNLIG